MGYMIQDVQCLKCGEVKPDNLVPRCSCSGFFTTLIPTNNLIKILKIFRMIATKCQMPILAESVQFMLTNVS